MGLSMTSDIILYLMKFFYLFNVRNHNSFYQSQLINQCSKKTEIPESRNHGKTEFFLWDIEVLTFLARFNTDIYKSNLEEKDI